MLNTSEEYRKKVHEINNLTHEEMARLVRFGKSGHEYFDLTKPLYAIFKNRWQAFGGMTAAMSKKIGWDNDDRP